MQVTNIKFLLTNACNFRCRFCHNEFQQNKRAKKFDLVKVENLIDKHLAKFKSDQLLNFKFSGGEPTLEMETLVELLDFSQNYDIEKRILISNLTSLTVNDVRLLISKGINEIRVNIPSFDKKKFKFHTGTKYRSHSSISKTLDTLRLFKNEGCSVRINSVISELETQDQITSYIDEMINKAKDYKHIDEVYFIADYYSKNEKYIYDCSLQYLKQIDNSSKIRRGRIHYGKFDNLLVSVSRCLDRANNEEDETEIYIIPDGDILKEYNYSREIS